MSTTFYIEDDMEILTGIGPEFPDNAISFDFRSGKIPAGSSFLVKISFAPSVVYMLSSKNYVIRTDSGNSERFNCLGSGMGLEVSLSSRVCNFGEVKAGNTSSRIISVENKS